MSTDAAEAGVVRHPLPARLIHDLRTPLSQIIGYTEMMAEQAQEEDAPRFVPDLHKVTAAGYRMLGVIETHFAGFATGPADEAPADDAEAGPGIRGGISLAQFILSNREPILAEWEAFARTCAPASTGMDIDGLRDHANAMLMVIAEDLVTPQTAGAQSDKSKGNAPVDAAAKATAAEEHGADRAENGFTVEQMVSEYRALRATVIRLWTRARGVLTAADLDDLTRFNEAIDQALAESITRYSDDLARSREMFLGILGHDLRTPLGAVLTSANFMLQSQDLPAPSRTLAATIANSSNRMVQMVGALLDLTRTRLGGGIPIVAAPMHMGRAARDVVNEMLAAHPDRTIQLDMEGDLDGEWDCARISQALSNLVANALDHGRPDGVVVVRIRGDAREVTLAVHNHGARITDERLRTLFDPMKGSSGKAHAGSSANLGLGLYIAERIVRAHGGSIHVDSSDEAGTTFLVRLPRGTRE
ncbi:MAG TPA: ATP-binding protein [Longimicrobium sp.]|uniref:sensor histidine kinase n=1 Tax=Longimicrobium sp. TaxID=2029185 RepID=UPI002EDBB7B5